MKFIFPLRVNKSKKKKFSLNLNQYRSAHYQVLNKAKREFADLFEEAYGYNQGPMFEKCSLEYTIFFPDNRVTDVMNLGSIVDKFASDCLVKFGYLKDDNRKILKKVSVEDGGIDRENPRAELIIKKYEEV